MATSNKRKLCVRSRAQSNPLVTGDCRGHDASFSARPLEAPGCSVYARQQGDSNGTSDTHSCGMSWYNAWCQQRALFAPSSCFACLCSTDARNYSDPAQATPRRFPNPVRFCHHVEKFAASQHKHNNVSPVRLNEHGLERGVHHRS